MNLHNVNVYRESIIDISVAHLICGDCVALQGLELRASSYEPGNWAGLVSGTKFAFCSCGKFLPG